MDLLATFCPQSDKDFHNGEQISCLQKSPRAELAFVAQAILIQSRFVISVQSDSRRDVGLNEIPVFFQRQQPGQ